MYLDIHRNAKLKIVNISRTIPWLSCYELIAPKNSTYVPAASISSDLCSLMEVQSQLESIYFCLLNQYIWTYERNLVP